MFLQCLAGKGDVSFAINILRQALKHEPETKVKGLHTKKTQLLLLNPLKKRIEQFLNIFELD